MYEVKRDRAYKKGHDLRRFDYIVPRRHLFLYFFTLFFFLLLILFFLVVFIFFRSSCLLHYIIVVYVYIFSSIFLAVRLDTNFLEIFFRY